MENTNTTATALREALKKGIVRFTFYKKDGTIREATGTRNLSFAEKTTGESIPAPKSGRINENAYYDLDKKAWRSFIPENVVSIDA